MINVALDVLILIFAVLIYQDMKIKRVAAKQDGEDFVAMQLYRKHLKRDRPSHD